MYEMVEEETVTHRPSISQGTAMTERAAILDERRANPLQWMPIPTHIPALNEVLLGFPREAFYWLLTAKKKLGKTTIAMDFAEAWRKGLGLLDDGTPDRILYVQLEELAHQFADRTFASMTSLSKNDIRMLDISDEQMKEIYEAAKQVSEGNDNLFIQDDIFGMDAVIQHGLGLGINKFVFDNLTLFDMAGIPGGSEREKLSVLSKKLVKYRNHNGVSCIVIAQEGGNNQAFGSSQPDMDADIRTLIDYVYEDAPDGDEGKKATKKNPVIMPGQRRIYVLPSRLAPEGYADVAFDGKKNKISPITTMEINDPSFEEILRREGPPPVVMM